MDINLSTLMCYRLFYVVKLNEQLIDKEMMPLNLSRTQWKVMARFNYLPMPCTQQQLLISMGIDSAHLTRTLDQLEQRDFVVRTRQASDKRAYNISLTDTGNKLLKKIEKILQLESDAIMNGMNEHEKSALRKLIYRIESNIKNELEKN